MVRLQEVDRLAARARSIGGGAERGDSSPGDDSGVAAPPPRRFAPLPGALPCGWAIGVMSEVPFMRIPKSLGTGECQSGSGEKLELDDARGLSTRP